ncbi:hypothetical protein AAF712_016870, partial [Marasmius tenuissimus]
LLNGKPVNSLTIPACYPRIAQLFNNDPECSVGGRFSIFNSATGTVVLGSKIDSKLFKEFTRDVPTSSQPRHDSLGLDGLEAWKQDAIVSNMWSSYARESKNNKRKQARLSNKPYEKSKKRTLAAQSSNCGASAPPTQPAAAVAVSQSTQVTAPSTGNAFQPIDLTSAFSTPEPSQNNPPINFFDLPDVNLGNFFGDGAPVASGSGTASTSGTSSASVGLEGTEGVEGGADAGEEDELA